MLVRHKILVGVVIPAIATGTCLVVPSTADASAEAGAPDTFVSQWDAIGSQALTAAALPPTDGHTIFAYESIAVYDAVTALRPGYEPFAVRATAPAGASVEAAVAAAAHRILVHYVPGQAAALLDPAYASSLAGISAGQSKSDGIALGEQVAAELISVRADDGFRAPVTYTPPNPPVPGVWLPTAPTPPAGTYLGRMRPFALDSADQFRPAGPPALDSKRWAHEFNEVKDLGSSSSPTRTPDQTIAARFWAEAPVQQGHNALRRFVGEHDLDVGDAARFMAMVSVTFADAQIACYDAKYHYAFWRPITAIRAGDTDDNDATVGDAAWSPLLPATPNHPDYPSAHSCITPTVGLVIARFLGTGQIDLTIPSLTGLGDRHYATATALTDDVSNARIWGGIHFRSAVEDGTDIARRTAHYMLAHEFRPVGD
jgi:hypothetical protein